MLTVTIHYCVAFRFMGSYNWGYKSPDMAYKCSYPTYNPTYTAHEPSSRDVHFRPRAGRGICSRGKLGDVQMSRHLQGSCCFFWGVSVRTSLYGWLSKLWCLFGSLL